MSETKDIKDLFSLLEEQNELSREILNHQFKYFNEACNHLCGVLDQSYAGHSEDDTGVYRTTYNYDAAAVWFLKEHGYVEVLEGEWPKTKYITFKFTEKRGV